MEYNSSNSVWVEGKLLYIVVSIELGLLPVFENEAHVIAISTTTAPDLSDWVVVVWDCWEGDVLGALGRVKVQSGSSVAVLGRSVFFLLNCKKICDLLLTELLVFNEQACFGGFNLTELRLESS